MTSNRAADVDLFSVGGDGIFQAVEEPFTRLLGLSHGEVNGRSLLEFVHPQDTPAIIAALSAFQRGAPEVRLENRFLSNGGGTVHLQWVARPVPGTAVWAASGQETTEFHRLLNQISELQARLDLVVGHGTASMWELDVRQGRMTWDAQAAHVLGVTSAAVPGTMAEFAALVQEDDREPVFAAVPELVETGEFELEVRTGKGDDLRHLLLRGKVVERDHRDRPRRAVGLALDVTAEKAMEEQMRQTAMTDALTGVPNRRAFDEALSNEARRSSRTLEPLSVLMIDIDNFKGFNDTFGHLVGDAALIAVARSLSGNIQRAGDVLARFGGEEFAVVLPGADERGAFEFAERLVETVRSIAIQEAPDWSLRVSVGTASWHPSAAQLDGVELLNQADQALYAAKAAGKDRAIAYAQA